MPGGVAAAAAAAAGGTEAGSSTGMGSECWLGSWEVLTPLRFQPELDACSWACLHTCMESVALIILCKTYLCCDVELCLHLFCRYCTCSLGQGPINLTGSPLSVHNPQLQKPVSARHVKKEGTPTERA